MQILTLSLGQGQGQWAEPRIRAKRLYIAQSPPLTSPHLHLHRHSRYPPSLPTLPSSSISSSRIRAVCKARSRPSPLLAPVACKVLSSLFSSLSVSLANYTPVTHSISALSEDAHEMHSTPDRGYLASLGNDFQSDYWDDVAQDECQADRQDRQDRYQLSIADIMHEDYGRCGHPTSPAAEIALTETSSTSTATPKPADNQDDNWSSSQSEAGRSDRSSSMEDVIPPSIWRVGRPAALHPTKSDTVASIISAAPKLRCYSSMSHVGPSSNVMSPSFWGVVKHPVFQDDNPLVPTPNPSRNTRRRPPTVRRVHGMNTARQDPGWQAAMATTGKGISVTMGLYLDGEITVNGQHAATVLRDPPCRRCIDTGRECRVVDTTKDKNLVSGICGFCTRQRRKCATG